MNNKQLAEMIKHLREQKIKKMPGNGKKFNPGKGSATHGQDPAGPNVLHEFQAQSRVGHQQRGKATLGDIDRRQKIIHAISKPLGKRIRNRYTSP